MLYSRPVLFGLSGKEKVIEPLLCPQSGFVLVAVTTGASSAPTTTTPKSVGQSSSPQRTANSYTPVARFP